MVTRYSGRLVINCEGCVFVDKKNQQCTWILEPTRAWQNGKCLYYKKEGE